MRRLTAVLAFVLVAACGGDTGGVTTTAAGGESTTTSVSTTAPAETTTTTTTIAVATGPLRGFSISPQDSSAEAFAGFLELVEESSTLLEWVGDGFEWADDPGTPDITIQLAAQAGVEPITIGGWVRTEDGSLLRPLDETNFETYVEAARGYAGEHSPRYMGFGVEIDTHWREFPDQWERSTELFDAVAAAIHEASPDTHVFVVFQLERLRGMQGGLFGGENSDDLAAWHLLDDFPEADLIGFTTYPGIVFESPADIPDDYYTSIAGHTSKPVIFSEMGWHAGGDFGPWSGSEEHQAEFVERFPALIDGLDVEFYTWSFLFDQPVPGVFGTMGLFTSDGTPRPAWDTWLEMGDGR